MAETKKKVAPSIGTIARQGGVVVVEVGPEHVRYEVHKTLLVHHSGYFRGALSESWREAEDFKAVIEDVEPTTFNVFLSWLYTGKTPTDDGEWIHVAEANIPGDDGSSGAKLVEVMALQAIAFGDRSLTPSFQEAVRNHFVDIHCNRAPPQYTSVIYAYTNMAKDNPILDLHAEKQAWYWNDDDDNEEERSLRPELPNNFLVRVMQKFAALRGARELEYEPPLDRSKYYFHPRKGQDKGDSTGADREEKHG
ncbi:hypothetical protein P171DRAFT_81468 [Karstenula rhodostoma CBS 690.94]|uniref:BTB domain-containing protein n=1 Tax=Karstenula rhodostoma CBS 690.94 TaxID=1392251 RepID=A0A9P4PBC1_9PLEO|nr:hypothetical protein P171DRAFT_81468 [Karstenula rhodostoma CBS 690.94]